MLSDVEIEVEDVLRNLDNLCDAVLSGTLQEGMTKVAQTVLNEARKIINKKTNGGNKNDADSWLYDDEAEQVRKSLTYKVTSSEAVVGSKELMAIWMHQGTGLYAVNGDGRKEVPWFWKDEDTKKTMASSGRLPVPFLTEAVQNKKEEILKGFSEMIREKYNG